MHRAALARLGPKSEQLPQCLDAHGVLAGLRALPTDLVEHRRTIDRPARYETPQRGEVLQSLAVSLRPLRLSCRGPDELDRRLVTRQCASYRVIRPDLERLSDEHPREPLVELPPPRRAERVVRHFLYERVSEVVCRLTVTHALVQDPASHQVVEPMARVGRDETRDRS